MSYWRRLRAWQEACAWDELHQVLLVCLRIADKINGASGIVDLSSICALGLGQTQAPNPTYHAHPGSKHYLITGAQGILLVISLSHTNRNGVPQLLFLVEAIQSIH